MHTDLKPSFLRSELTEPFDLVALGFVSRSTHELGILGLVNLCVQSYCNNVELGLTGILFFNGYHFGQVLEGHRDVVNNRWQVIQRDQRHSEVHMIAHKDIARRNFSNWTMHAPDAESIVMLFPELSGMIRPIHALYDGSEVLRVMSAYPIPESEQRIMRYALPSIH
jgi:hypothetical protein